MGIKITEIVDAKKCAYCQGKIKWYQRRGSDKRFHWTCEFILGNNKVEPREYANERFRENEHRKVVLR